MRVVQQPLPGCAFCDGDSEPTGTAYTWGVDERIAVRICVDCATQHRPDPEEPDHRSCDGCGAVVDTGAALTRFRVALGRLEGPLQLCADCCPAGPATFWTRDLEEHRLDSSPT
jgi:hypothetical protein